MTSIVTKGLLVRSDIAPYDGVNDTVARRDSTGGTITSLSINDFVDVLQVYGNGVSRTFGTIQTCINRIGSTRNRTLLFSPGTWVIDQNLTIGSNFSCYIPAGCVFSVSSGKTLTFSGPVIRDSITWTSGSGTVTESRREAVSVTDFTTSDIRAGVIDAYATFVLALASGAKTVLVPNGTYKMSAGITIPDGVTLLGQSMIPADQTGTPAGSVLKFDSTVSVCVTLGAANNQTANISTLVVWRTGTPSSGSVGIFSDRINNPQYQNVAAVNHAIAFKFFASGSSGIQAQMLNCYASDITEKYFYVDGWPELRVTGGRMGRIGSGEAAGTAFIYITASGSAGSGMGPNTLCFENVQFNQGTAGPSYFIEFDSVSIAQGNQVIYNFVNCHVENLTTAFIKTTSSAPYLQKLNLISCNLQATAAAFFAIDNATQINQCNMMGCHIGCSGMTLATTSLVNVLQIVGCDITGNASFTGTSGAQNNMFIAASYFVNALTLAGTWQDLQVNAQVAGSVTNSAVQYNSSSRLTINLPGVLYSTSSIDDRASYTGTGPQLYSRSARGSSASPTISSASDAAGHLRAWLHDGSAFGQMGVTRFVNSGGAPSAGSTPGSYIVSTAAVGAVTATDRVKITDAGYLDPVTDNAYQCGETTLRWSSLWSANGTVQTSDIRSKKDIEVATLGLDFINSLRPVSYKFKVGGNDVIRQAFNDKDGNEIPEGHPIPDDATPGRIVTRSKPGTRTHWGLISQEVKAACDIAGVDFGGWLLTDKHNPDSEQALRYDQFISPLIKAVQQLTERVQLLESQQP